MKNKTNSFFCSQEAIRANELPIGTASMFNKLILIQYEMPFKESAFEESELSENVKNYLNDYLKTKADCRILLIKKGKTDTSKKISIFTITNDVFAPFINQKIIENYSDILDIDFDSMFAEKFSPIEKEMVIVCTNGTKDKCCSKFGLPIFNELSKYDTIDVWQCSHIGGDRYAPTLIVLPYCIYYGHLDKNSVNELVQHINNKEIFLSKYRGRTSLHFYSQAAEYFLRESLSNSKLYELEFVSQEKIDSNYCIVFKVKDKSYKVTISIEKTDYTNYLECNSTKLITSNKYVLHNIDSLLD